MDTTQVQIEQMDKRSREQLQEIDRKLEAIMTMQDANADRLTRILDALVPPPEGSVSTYSR